MGWAEEFMQPFGVAPRKGRDEPLGLWLVQGAAPAASPASGPLAYVSTTTGSGSNRYNWTFTAPETGFYQFTAQGGGSGSNYQAAHGGAAGGLSQRLAEALVAGQIISFAAGSGGAAAPVGGSPSAGADSIITLPSGVITGPGGGVIPPTGGLGSGGDINLRGGSGAIGAALATMGEGDAPTPLPAQSTYGGGGAPGLRSVPKIFSPISPASGYLGSGAVATSSGSQNGYPGFVCIRRVA